MTLESFRELHLLQELTQNPRLTQRDLGKRIGAALGLTNLIVHRLCASGFIKIVEVEKNRNQYLITPEGIAQKGRLASEYLEYSLRYYCGLRRFLREHLIEWAEQGVDKILLYGPGEVAEVAYLTIQEVGLRLIGIVGDRKGRQFFLNLPVRDISEIPSLEFDRVIVATLQSSDQDVQLLLNLGIPEAKILQFPQNQTLLPNQGIREWLIPPGHLVSRSSVSPSDAGFLEQEKLSKKSLRVGPPKLQISAEETDVVVLCGGRGMRLGSLTQATPKPLLQVGEEPFLLRLLLQFKQQGFRRFILAAHYLSDQFRSFLTTYESLFPAMELVVEPEPLGTGGAIRYASQQVHSHTFIVLNGDSLVQQLVLPVMKEHWRFKREFTVIAVQAQRVEGEPIKKGVWRVGPDGEVKGFATEEAVSEGWVNAGCYVLDRSMVHSWPLGSYSLEANLPILLNAREAGVFRSEGRLLDIGTPQVYGTARELLASFTLATSGASP